MRKMWTLVLVLLFTAATPMAWGQDDSGDDEMQAGDEWAVVADEPGDEQVESDQGADSEGMAEPEADEAADDEPTESEAAEESSADEGAFAGEEDISADMTDAGDSGEDAESEGGDAFADDATEPNEASDGESAAADGSFDATEQIAEEEEAEDSADDDALVAEGPPSEMADGEAQTADSGGVEGAGGNDANANQPSPAPPAPPAPAANPGGAQSSEGTAWPTPTFRFMVNFGTGDVPFQEVSGLDVEAQIIEYRRPDSMVNTTTKMPGIAKNGNVTLRKGMFAKDSAFWDWQKKISMNQIERRTVTIRLLDDSGASLMTWTLTNAWPTKITGTDLTSDTEAAVESIEIEHEGLTIVRQ